MSKSYMAFLQVLIWLCIVIVENTLHLAHGYLEIPLVKCIAFHIRQLETNSTYAESKNKFRNPDSLWYDRLVHAAACYYYFITLR